MICAVALLAGTVASGPGAVTATDLGAEIASSRRSQAYYESSMLAQDAAIGRIAAETRVTRRALRDAKRAVTQAKVALRIALAVVQQRSARLAELEAMYAESPAEEIPAGHTERLREVGRDLARARNRRAHIGQRYRSTVRVRQARQQHLSALKRERRLAISRRESAEAGLGAYIVRMTRLAELRAEIQSDALLTTASGFTWPSVGRISQTYGCTGFYLNPRRGSCRHFHDGLDIVAGYGSRVSTVADGVVAYAGWNPWDEKGRAWLMVVSHPDGFVTRYGHLLPGPLARVGQYVRQGQAIGRMGNTGRSTGTHLHFELLRGGSTVSPLAYLPAGMVTVMEPRHSDKRGHGQARHKRTERSGQHSRGKGSGDQRATSPASAQAMAGEEASAGVPGLLASESGFLPFTEGAIDAHAFVCTSRANASSASELGVSSSDATTTSADEGEGSTWRLDEDPCADLLAARTPDASRARATSATAGVAGSRQSPVDPPMVRESRESRESGVPRPYRGTSPAPA
jgi:murein DD-endopeptidase MepM/ murein hydrolase activator NlpD